ncbi:glutamyl-tRNA reductase [Microaerobacter geothermalis]|uniref:glutamyl-tRNA reductase n=1 Tax=Microaerobacter geothermalis TaxID=674972 RepID=UPI001F02724B|nr:glutamyl-tRNA reductase [Microaerobacter geothermalis]MCF6092666.1 glutamyl-tRNA reductase [Microaerobacter geothermalis]
MHILTIGLNYKTAPVEIREKFAFQADLLPHALTQLRNTKSILECVILSTCNRMELYLVVDYLHSGEETPKIFLSEWFGIPKKEFSKYLYLLKDDEAIIHLFRVTCGLDSMVLGETQILGQVKEAWFTAQSCQSTGSLLNTLFKQAVTLAKKAHSETQIGENAVSVSYAAVELGKKIFGSFSEKSVLVIGAGEMSELTAKHFHANGAKNVMVVNRTLERAEKLSSQFGGKAFTMEQLNHVMIHADIVVSSTGSNHYVVTKEDISKVLKARNHRPLFLIDIAVPRDLDPAINELDNVYLYDIDDLEGIVEANLQERAKEAERIKAMIEEELVAFKNWVNTLGVVPLITSLRKKATAIQEETMQSILNKMPNLTDREVLILKKHTKSIVNQLLRDPILRIKEMSAESNGDEALEMFSKIFALEEQVEKEEKKQVLTSSKEQQVNSKTIAAAKITVHS